MDLVNAVIAEAFKAGCDWVHVDYEPHLADFYENACGFRPTPAGFASRRRITAPGELTSMTRPLSDEETADLLASDTVARLATIDASGYPHVTPLW